MHVPSPDSPEFEVLLCKVSMIIDPEAFMTFDDLTPTERTIWNEKRGRLQGAAGSKTRAILELFRNGQTTAGGEDG